MFLKRSRNSKFNSLHAGFTCRLLSSADFFQKECFQNILSEPGLPSEYQMDVSHKRSRNSKFLTHCMSGLHVVFCLPVIFFFKISDVKNYFGTIINVSKGFDQDQGPSLGLNCFQA